MVAYTAAEGTSQYYVEVPRPGGPLGGALWRGADGVLSMNTRHGGEGKQALNAPAASTGLHPTRTTGWEGWMKSWKKKIDNWWAFLPAAARPDMAACFGALGLHFAQRLQNLLGEVFIAQNLFATPPPTGESHIRTLAPTRTTILPIGHALFNRPPAVLGRFDECNSHTTLTQLSHNSHTTRTHSSHTTHTQLAHTTRTRNSLTSLTPASHMCRTPILAGSSPRCFALFHEQRPPADPTVTLSSTRPRARFRTFPTSRMRPASRFRRSRSRGSFRASSSKAWATMPTATHSTPRQRAPSRSKSS